ncbi:MAG: hydrogenase small subunit [Thermodesulfobacteriota bacterium]
MEPKTKEYPVIWLQCATCTGCSVSILNSVSPTIKNILIDEVVPGKHVNLRFHATIMAGAGDLAMEVAEETMNKQKNGYLLVVEGSIPTAQNGVYGAIGERNHQPVSMVDRVLEFGRDALAIIALGTCATFGGIPAAAPNPTGCVGTKELLQSRGLEKPVINISGCPPHPDWFVGTVASILLRGLPSPEELDDFGRPLAFYGKLIHENCQRRAYFDEGKFAKKHGDPGCLYELGCKGPLTYADCPIRLWNTGVNWCVGSGGGCHGCTQPEFPDLVSPLYVKTIEIESPLIKKS